MHHVGLSHEDWHGECVTIRRLLEQHHRARALHAHVGGISSASDLSAEVVRMLSCYPSMWMSDGSNIITTHAGNTSMSPSLPLYEGLDRVNVLLHRLRVHRRWSCGMHDEELRKPADLVEAETLMLRATLHRHAAAWIQQHMPALDEHGDRGKLTSSASSRQHRTTSSSSTSSSRQTYHALLVSCAARWSGSCNTGGARYRPQEMLDALQTIMLHSPCDWRGVARQRRRHHLLAAAHDRRAAALQWMRAARELHQLTGTDVRVLHQWAYVALLGACRSVASVQMCAASTTLPSPIMLHQQHADHVLLRWRWLVHYAAVLEHDFGNWREASRIYGLAAALLVRPSSSSSSSSCTLRTLRVDAAATKRPHPSWKLPNLHRHRMLRTIIEVLRLALRMSDWEVAENALAVALTAIYGLHLHDDDDDEGRVPAERVVMQNISLAEVPYIVMVEALVVLTMLSASPTPHHQHLAMLRRQASMERLSVVQQRVAEMEKRLMKHRTSLVDAEVMKMARSSTPPTQFSATAFRQSPQLLRLRQRYGGASLPSSSASSRRLLPMAPQEMIQPIVLKDASSTEKMPVGEIPSTYAARIAQLMEVLSAMTLRTREWSEEMPTNAPKLHVNDNDHQDQVAPQSVAPLEPTLTLRAEHLSPIAMVYHRGRRDDLQRVGNNLRTALQRLGPHMGGGEELILFALRTWQQNVLLEPLDATPQV